MIFSFIEWSWFIDIRRYCCKVVNVFPHYLRYGKDCKTLKLQIVLSTQNPFKKVDKEHLKILVKRFSGETTLLKNHSPLSH